MSFPNPFRFVHGGATYHATLVHASDSPAPPTTGVCCLCQQSLLDRDYYVITCPSLFHVHAECAMAASAGHGDEHPRGGQQYYGYYPPQPPPPPPSSCGWRPSMQNCSYYHPAQCCNPPPPYYTHPPPPPPMNYSCPPSSHYCQPPPAPEQRNRSSAAGSILKTVAHAAKELLFTDYD